MLGYSVCHSIINFVSGVRYGVLRYTEVHLFSVTATIHFCVDKCKHKT